MSTQRLPQTDDTLFMVSQWKEDLDKSAPWWQRWFYRFAYVPFNEFSLKVMKIPPYNETVVEGTRVTFRRWEVEGFFGSEHEADLGCLTERWCYKDYPFGRLMPPDSGQCGNGPTYPRAKNPTKRLKPVLSMAITPQQKLSQLEAEVTNLRQTIKR